MKKIVITLLSLCAVFFTQVNIQGADAIGISTMGTYITVNLYNQGSEEHYSKIKEIYEYYDYLGSNYLRTSSVYGDLNYVYSINLDKGNEVSVNDDLYAMIKFSLEMMEETNGYFNPLIGEAVDVWKELIQNHTNQTITKEVYDEVILQLKDIPVITKEDIVLDDVNKTVKLLGHAKLDLGAIAKGYATQKVVDYLISKEVTTYNIDAGSSSIAFGIHPENRPFKTGLKDPYKLFEDNLYNIYGILSAQDTHVVTSGDYIQYVKYNNQILHHIIDPHDYMPKNYYHTITITGSDGGRLDAYSTAIFNMPEAEAVTFLESRDMFYSFYKKDGVVHNFSESVLQLMKMKEPIIDEPTPNTPKSSNILILIYILSGIVLVFGSIITVMMIKERKHKNEQKTTD
ncbi:MAG: FAD:protein FMN transferase [Acholeplasmataceae bacterium]